MSSIFNIKDIKDKKDIKNINDLQGILKYYNLEREKILKKIIYYPEYQIYSDKKKDFWCISHDDNIHTYTQKCFECNLLKSLIPDNMNFSAIFGGKLSLYNKKNLDIISEKFYFPLKRRESNKCYKISNFIEKIYSSYIFSIKDKNRTVYYTSDENTLLNYLTIQLILDHILDNNYILHSYNCKENLNIIQEDIGQKLSDILKKKEKKYNIKLTYIVIQLVFILNILKEYSFTHNWQSLSNLLIINKKKSIFLKGKEYIFPFTLFLKASKYSAISIFYNEEKVWKRFFPSSGEIGSAIKMVDFPVEDVKKFSNIKKNKEVYFYKIGIYSQQFLNMRINYGCSIFIESFDIVMFMVSLYIYYKDEMKISKFWRGIWLSNERQNLQEELNILYKNREENEERSYFLNIYKIVSKYYIRIDTLNFIMDII